MKINEEIKIADVVSENIKAADIFKKHGIDFCCGGGISIAKACEKKNISVDELLKELESIDNKIMPSQNYNKWEIDFLCDYIVNTHHAYVSEAIPLILAYANKVAKVHGHAHPAVIEINEKFKTIADELKMHMVKEERVLFPYIKNMVTALRNNEEIPKPPFGEVANPIHMMEAEHETVGNALKEIAQLSNQYSPPDWACNTFKALYAKLQEFEQDLHIHVHLENNILFPKALALENNAQWKQ